MSRKEKFLFIFAVITVYIFAFGGVALIDKLEKEEMRQITTTIEMTDAEYDAFELKLAEFQRYGLLKDWTVGRMASVYASSGVSHHLKRYLEQDVDEQERYFVPAPKEQAEVTKPPFWEPDATPSDNQRPAPSEDIPDLMLRCVQAEAGNQCYEGKLAVAEVIRNRLNSDIWPSTIEEVILQPGQFGVVANGSIYNVTPDLDTINAVEAALNGSVTIPTDYVYFNTTPNGADPIQIQDHYFCR